MLLQYFIFQKRGCTNFLGKEWAVVKMCFRTAYLEIVRRHCALYYFKKLVNSRNLTNVLRKSANLSSLENRVYSF